MRQLRDLIRWREHEPDRYMRQKRGRKTEEMGQMIETCTCRDCGKTTFRAGLALSAIGLPASSWTREQLENEILVLEEQVESERRFATAAIESERSAWRQRLVWMSVCLIGGLLCGYAVGVAAS